ncbi:MAG: hypothetical protein IJU52_00310 [Clostridia bacterium]|nr:hypothetical protein [Clostridia bacterium]
MNCPVCNENLPEGSICCPLCGEHIASKIQQNKVKAAKNLMSERIEEAFSSPAHKAATILLHVITAVCLLQLTVAILTAVRGGQGFVCYAITAIPALVYFITSILGSIFGWRLTKLSSTKNTDLIGTQKVFGASRRAMLITLMIFGIAAISLLVVVCLLVSIGLTSVGEAFKDNIFAVISSVIGKDFMSMLTAGEGKTVTIVVLLITLVVSLVVWIVACCLIFGTYKRANVYYGKIVTAYWKAEYDQETKTPSDRCIVIGVLIALGAGLPLLPLVLSKGPVFGSLPTDVYLLAAVPAMALCVLFGAHLILTGLIFSRIHEAELKADADYQREIEVYEEMETRTRLELAEYDRRKKKAEQEAEDKKRRELEEKEARIRMNNEQQQQMMQALLLQMMSERLGEDAVKKFMEQQNAAPAEKPTEEQPTEEQPAEEAPAEEAPTEEAPAEEKPAKEAPTEEAPTEEAPTEEKPAKEAPAEEAPTEEKPAKEAPTKEAPKDGAPSAGAPGGKPEE